MKTGLSNQLSARDVVLETVGGIQGRLSGARTDLSDDDKVIPTIAGFDSLCGLEASVIAGHRLGRIISDNIFVSEDGKQALTLFQSVQRLEKLLQHAEAVE